MAIILCSGFDETLYPRVRIEGGLDRSTVIVTLTKADLALSLDTIVQRTENSPPRGSLSDNPPDIENGTGVLLQHYVIFAGERSSLDAVMKGFKKVYKAPSGSIIFAMLTETARSWILEKYLEELGQEHEAMRNYASQGMLHEKNIEKDREK